MSQRHLKKGEALPPLKKGTLRLYSMYFCPYAQRARLVLAHKNIPHEVVNINLKEKPDWFLQKNPQGGVPVMEQDGKIIVESAICMDYLEDKYPGNALYPKDPYEKARAKMKMEFLSKVVTAFYNFFVGGKEKSAENLVKFEEDLTKFNNLIDGKFLLGQTLTMTDLFIWPWVERMSLITAQLGSDVIDKKKFPKLSSWRDAMLEVPAVKKTMHTPENHMKFTVTYVSGNPDYDFLF